MARFLKRVRCENLYLVGDMIDMWRLRSRWHWLAEHNDVLRRILKHAKRGTRVVFIPGDDLQDSLEPAELAFMHSPS